MLKINFFTLKEFETEQKWLEDMARQGWVLETSYLPCFYFFKKCKPQNLVYRYDFYTNPQQKQECIDMYEEYGWTNIHSMNDFLLFRHPAGQDIPEAFGNDEAKQEMIERIIKKKLGLILIMWMTMIAITIFNGYMVIQNHLAMTSIVITVLCCVIVGVLLISQYRDLKQIQKEF